MADKEIPKIVIDTREQLPYWDKDIIRRKLDVGDYSLEGFENIISIERKSLGDLFGTLGKGNKRFKNEINKSFSFEYFAIVIEGTYADIINKNFDGSYRTKMKGYVVASILLTLHIKYGIKVFFCKNRVEAKSLTKALLNNFYKHYVKKVI